MPGFKRLLALGGLVVAEYLLVSLLFDVRALRYQEGPLSMFAYLGDAASVVLLAGAGVLILQGPKLSERISEAARTQTAPRRVWSFLFLHFVAYGVFLALSARVLAEGAERSVVTTWIVPWLLSGVLLVGLLVPVALPLSAARALLSSGLSALAAAGVMGLLIWGLGTAGELLWPALSGPTLETSAWLLARVSNEEVVKTSDWLFGTPDFVVEIAPQCSGLEGMGLMVAFLGGFMVLNRHSLRFPRALWVLPLAVAASWAANVIRIVALVLVGTWVSPEVAIGGFHSKAGWFLFCLLAFGFVVLLRRMPYLARETATSAAVDAGPDHVSAYLMPLLALLATALVTGLLSGGFDLFYGLRVAVVAAVLWVYRSSYRAIWARPSWEAVAIGVAVFAVWIALVPRHDAASAEPLVEGLAALSPPAQFSWIALRVVGSVALVPIVEELAFRGYLLRRLVSANFTEVPYRTLTFISFAVSSLAFGLMHSALLAGTLAGMAYALAQYRRGRLIDAIAAHAVTNGLIAVDVLVNDAWALW